MGGIAFLLFYLSCSSLFPNATADHYWLGVCSVLESLLPTPLHWHTSSTSTHKAYIPKGASKENRIRLQGLTDVLNIFFMEGIGFSSVSYSYFSYCSVLCQYKSLLACCFFSVRGLLTLCLWVILRGLGQIDNWFLTPSQPGRSYQGDLTSVWGSDGFHYFDKGSSYIKNSA